MSGESPKSEWSTEEIILGSIVGAETLALGTVMSSRYVGLKMDERSGVRLKKEDAQFVKVFSEFLSMKQGEGETLLAFNQRKKEFLTKNYQDFVQYKKFAKQLKMSLTDYVSMNADVVLNRSKWVKSLRELNKELGGRLSDEMIEKLSKRVVSFSPTVKGSDGVQNIHLNTEELLKKMVRKANTPPDGKYFACMLEDFVNMPKSKPVFFMPDNGWLQKNMAGGVHWSYSAAIQMKNNDMVDGTLMHEIHHHVNKRSVRMVQRFGHEHLGRFFDEALSRSDNWLVDEFFQKNAVLKDIRLHYEMMAESLFPNDPAKQARYVFKEARGRYISIMLAGDEKSIQAEMDDFYLKTGAKKTAKQVDFDNIQSEVSDWYDYYQSSYNYRIQKGGETTRTRVNEYLKEHFGADVKMGENLLFELDEREKKLPELLANKDRSVCVDPKKAKQIVAEWKKRGVELTQTEVGSDIRLEVPEKYSEAFYSFLYERGIQLNEDLTLCFKPQKRNGKICYECIGEREKYPYYVKMIKEHYQKLGIQVDIHPETGRLTVHSDSVEAFESFYKNKIDSLRIQDFKTSGNGFVLDSTGMDQKTRHDFMSKYEEFDVYPIDLVGENKILIEQEDIDRFKRLREYDIAIKTSRSSVDFANDGVEVVTKHSLEIPKHSLETPNVPKGRVARVVDAIQKGRAALNGAVDNVVSSAVKVGIKAAAPVLNTKAGQRVVQGAQKVGAMVSATKAGVVARISKVPGGARALKAMGVVGKVAKVGGPAVSAAMAAVDPKGTKQMYSDVVHGRWDKVFKETVEGTVSLVTNPDEVGQYLWDATTNTISDHYQGAETVWDYTVKTGEGLGKGLSNTADVLTHIGVENHDLIINSTMNAQMAGLNWIGSQMGMDSAFVMNQYEYKEYQKDPVGYVCRFINPIMEDRKTGLRDDDTFFSVVESGNIKRFNAFLEKGGEIPNKLSGNIVSKNIDGVEVEEYGYNPYNTALGVAIGAGQVDMAMVLYHKKDVNINGVNKANGDTTLMSLLKQMAPDEGSLEYYSGAFLDIAKNNNYTEKTKKNFTSAMVMVDGMLQDKTLDVHATNMEGKDAFMVAAETGHYLAVETLKNRGADIHRTTKNGSNALHFCTHNELMTHRLIALGLDVNHVNNNGQTPLMVAFQKHENINTIDPLLAKTDDKGLAALLKSEKHIAYLASYLQKEPYALCHVIKNPKMMGALLAMGLDANIPNKEGKTPLMLALESGQIADESMALLLDSMDEKGVELLAKSAKHQSLLDRCFEEKPDLLMVMLANEKHPLNAFLSKKHPELKQDVMLALKEMEEQETGSASLQEDGVQVVVETGAMDAQNEGENKAQKPNAIATLAKAGQNYQELVDQPYGVCRRDERT